MFIITLIMSGRMKIRFCAGLPGDGHNHERERIYSARDENTEIEWSKIIGGSGPETGSEIAPTPPEGGYILPANTLSDKTLFWSGTLAWARTFHGSLGVSDLSHASAIHAGNFVSAGSTNSADWPGHLPSAKNNFPRWASFSRSRQPETGSGVGDGILCRKERRHGSEVTWRGRKNYFQPGRLKMRARKITGMLVVLSLIISALMPAVVAQSVDQGVSEHCQYRGDDACF
jgi:hypothetical protein